MSFPNAASKHEGTPLIRPEGFLRSYLDDAKLAVPAGAILGYSTRLPVLLEELGFEPVTGYPPPWRALWLRPEGDRVGVVCGFGIGAPAAAIVVEELATLGTSRFVSIGTAGALPDELDFGDTVLCTSAIRDEGTSHHYAPTEMWAHPSPALTEELRTELTKTGHAVREGPTWTLDAIYRETVEEATAYRDAGVLTVDMEASAIFTVAEQRSVEAGAMFTISDHLLAHEEWKRAPDPELLRAGLRRLLEVAISVLDR